MSNRLASSNSPYLLQHADNPVDWYPWGEEALQKAQQEDKPIFLSIGYAACHWCHVMAHESFEDPKIAEIMNRAFINIKVDREERPDIDSIYMNAVVAMTGQGGWPTSVFLTPLGEPFYGGTYFPPLRRYNLPSFRDILLTIERLWHEDRAKLLESSQQITQHLQRMNQLELSPKPLSPETLDQAAVRLAQSYDWRSGGWGQAPKFPQAMAIEFLLRRAALGDQLSLDVANHVLFAMSRGGMYDLIGGGFSRYSTDNDWLVPHFEKMLYDNALLARVYLYAYLITRDRRFREIHEATLDFILRELTSDEGGFFSSLDADSEGEEGKYYLWGFDEIRAVLSRAQETIHNQGKINWFDFCVAAYDLRAEGNFEGKIVLQRVMDEQALAEAFNISEDDSSELLRRINQALFLERQKRMRPHTDDKVILGWNALAMQAFSESARYLNRKDYLKAAQKNAAFIQKSMRTDGRLFRTWRSGQAQNDAFLEDYAGLILALLSLYQSDPKDDWFGFAHDITVSMLELFLSEEGKFYDTPNNGEKLILRPRNLQDNATPSGNSLAAFALLQMAEYTGKGKWRELAEDGISEALEAAARYPTAFSNWLTALHFALNPIKEVALLYPPENQDTTAFYELIWSSFRPNLLLASSSYPPSKHSPELLQHRPLLDNQTTIYVCRNFICERPVNTIKALREMLSD